MGVLYLQVTTSFINSQFLNRMTVDLSRPLHVLWSNEAPQVHLGGAANTHNCHILDQENTRMHTETSLYSQKWTVWGRLTATLFRHHFFFEEITARSPVTCFVTGQWYHDKLQTFIVPLLQQNRSLHGPF